MARMEEKKEKNALRISSYIKPKIKKTREKISNPPILDSGASVTMFAKKKDAESGSYKAGSSSTVQLAAGKDKVPCLGSGTLKFGNLSLPDAVHVQDLNGTLVSVGQI